MKELFPNNAAKRGTYVGDLFEIGTNILKDTILESIDSRFSELHEKGYIHISRFRGVWFDL